MANDKKNEKEVTNNSDDAKKFLDDLEAKHAKELEKADANAIAAEPVTRTEMSELQVVRINDVLEGRAVFTSGRGGKGKFAQIRAIAKEALKQKGEACAFYQLVKVVEAKLKLETPQKAYNYTGNALKSEIVDEKHPNRLFRVQLHNDRKILVRVK